MGRAVVPLRWGDPAREEAGRRAVARGEGGRAVGAGALAMEVDPLFSATTLRLFSNTFQSLIVLSVASERDGGAVETAYRWWRGESGQRSGACTSGFC